MEIFKKILTMVAVAFIVLTTVVAATQYIGMVWTNCIVLTLMLVMIGRSLILNHVV